MTHSIDLRVDIPSSSHIRDKFALEDPYASYFWDVTMDWS